MRNLLCGIVVIFGLIVQGCTHRRTTTLVYYEVGVPTKKSPTQAQEYDPGKSKKAYSGYERPRTALVRD